MNSFFKKVSVISLLTASSFALEIPSEILAKHQVACPSFDADYMMTEVYKLPKSEYGSANTLYILGCEMYAYNTMEKAYLANSYETKSVSVAEVTAAGDIYATDDLMGSNFDLQTLTLATFNKGRGLGDCGNSAEYKFDVNLEKFVLVEARSKQECDGEDTEWPVVYKK